MSDQAQPTDEEPNILSAAPLRAYLGDEHGKQTRFAIWLGISPQALNNWFRRGIPTRRLLAVCALMDITAEEYVRRASAGDSHSGPVYGSDILEAFYRAPEHIQQIVLVALSLAKVAA